MPISNKKRKLIKEWLDGPIVDIESCKVSPSCAKMLERQNEARERYRMHRERYRMRGREEWEEPSTMPSPTVAARPGPEETLFAQARVAFREMQAVPDVPAVDVQREWDALIATLGAMGWRRVRGSAAHEVPWMPSRR